LSVLLREMFPNELAAFRSYSVSDYADDLTLNRAIRSEEALVQAEQEFDELLPGSCLRVIEHAAHAVGVLWYLMEETDGIRHAFLNDFVIDPQYRRRGYGSSALSAFAREAKAGGCTQIRFYVADDNHAAKTLYERCGYRVLRRAQGGAYWYKEIG